MGNKSSLLLREEEIAQIQEETGFTPNQIERLYFRFTALDKNDCCTAAQEDFLRIPELAINPLSERIVHSFFAESHDDRVNFLQFMRVIGLKWHTLDLSPEKIGRINSIVEKRNYVILMQRERILEINLIPSGQHSIGGPNFLSEADTNNDQMICFVVA